METQRAGITVTPDFAAALDTLHRGEHLFLTGRAGTGKSTLIRTFLAETERHALIVAPTGIAALNVEGYTIHRLFSFPPRIDARTVRSGQYYPGRFGGVLRELDTLIVDEASMVRADLLDAMAAALERFGPRPGEPFGGVQLVLVGDLHQLPPVVGDAEAEALQERYETPYFFSAEAWSRNPLPSIELATVFRQQGDQRLVDILNHVRDGSLLDDARAELNARTDPGFDPDLDEFWLTLATTNRIVRARNRTMLERLPDPAQEYTAVLQGELDGFEEPTEECLSLALGAQVMLLNNDPLDRWVNGSIGRVEHLGWDAEEGEPVVRVRLREGALVDVRPFTWDVTQPVSRGGEIVHEVIGGFTQLPIKLAWAITIHKSQGQTLDRVVVDLTGGTFANGQLYVALSRCTSLEGLVLKRDVLPRDLKSDIRIRRFLGQQISATGALGTVFLSIDTVGHEGDRYRPRPVEIAVVTDDGDEATTLINPTSDLYDARTRLGLSTREIQLAPVMDQAWAALSPLLAGRVPVGPRIDEALGIIDFELKRCGVMTALPLGSELPRQLASGVPGSGTALERVRAMRTAARSLPGEASDSALTAGGGPFPAQARGRGYLLARAAGEELSTGPQGFLVGGNITALDDPAQVLAEELARAWERVVDRDAEVVERLREVERYYAVEILPADLVVADPMSPEAVLVPGARVCFTGEVSSPRHGVVDRWRMEQLAEERGLVLSANLTKTKTDVLVVAERGSQSNKAKNAARWGKPVLAAEDFLDWALG